MHFLNTGKWDITWILSLNCLQLFLPAICPNCATTIICLGWIWCSGSDLYHCSFPRDLTCPLHSNQRMPAQSSIKTCEVLKSHFCCVRKRRLSLWESLAPEWPAAYCFRLMHQQGSRPWVKQGLCLTGNKNLAWTSHECLECQAAVVQKVSLFIYTP